MTEKSLLHITPTVNIENIKNLGILTSQSQSSYQVVWFVDHYYRYWALAHVAHKHNTWELSILTVIVPRPLRTPFEHLFISRERIPPENILEYLRVEWFDPPDFLLFADIDEQVKQYVHGVPCPECGHHGACLAYGEKGRILAVKCAHCYLLKTPEVVAE